MFYRVLCLTLLDSRCEEGARSLPGGSCSLTGFWTPHEEAAIKLWQWREDAAMGYDGGGTWSVIVRTPTLTIVPPPEGAKSNHVGWLDDGEVFTLTKPPIDSVEVFRHGEWRPLKEVKNELY